MTVLMCMDVVVVVDMWLSISVCQTSLLPWLHSVLINVVVMWGSALHKILYYQNFCWTKFLWTHLHIPLHYRNILWNNFHPCSKDHQRFYVIIDMVQTIHRIKVSPMRAESKKAKFSPCKISGYTVCWWRIWVCERITCVLASLNLVLPLLNLDIKIIIIQKN